MLTAALARWVERAQRRAGEASSRDVKNICRWSSNGALLTTAVPRVQYSLVSSSTLDLSGRPRGIAQSCQCAGLQGANTGWACADKSLLRVQLHRASEKTLGHMLQTRWATGHAGSCAQVSRWFCLHSVHQSVHFTPARTGVPAVRQHTAMSTVHNAAGSSVPRPGGDAPQGPRRKLGP
jgi:hypothetical protein